MRSAALHASWSRRLARPLHGARIECVAECFDGTLAPDQVQAMLDNDRFEERLQQLLIRHFWLPPLEQLSESADLSVLVLDGPAFARLPLLCGAVWHAAALAREIRGPVVQCLKERLGTDVFNFALAHRAHAGAADFLLDSEQLAAAIERDGHACVAAWFHSRPQALQGWLQLYFDIPQSDVEISAAAIALVPQIAQALLEERPR